MTLTSKHPTRGAMVSELERLGVSVRGTALAADDKRLAAMLRERGYDVSAEPAPKQREESDR